MSESQSLVVCGDYERRMRLREALMTSELFRKVHVANNLRESREKLSEDGVKLDLVFLADSWSPQNFPEFIAEAKESKAARDSAFVLVLPEGEVDQGEISIAMASGIDAILVAPYSVERLQELVHLTDRIRRERGVKRLEGTIKYLVNNIHESLSEATISLKQRGRPGRHMDKLREYCGALENFDGDALNSFHHHLIEHFTQIAPPKKTGYQGASSRVRKKWQEWERKKRSRR